MYTERFFDLTFLLTDTGYSRCKDKVVIVTGTNSPIGIGRASAHQFARNGAKAVYICDFATTYLDVHKRELESLYPNVDIHVRRFDAGNEEQVKAVVDEAMQKYGRLDVMFANAGIVGQPKVFTEVSGDEFMRTMDTNAKGCVTERNRGLNTVRNLHNKLTETYHI